MRSGKTRNLSKGHLVSDLANLGNLDRDDITVVEPLGLLHTHSHTGRSTGHNDSALLKSGALGDERNDLGDVEEKVGRVGVLANLVVDLGGQLETRTVAENLVGHDRRANRTVLVKALREAPLGNTTSVLGIALPLAVRYIVRDGVARDIFANLVNRNIFASLANDDGLQLMIMLRT